MAFNTQGCGQSLPCGLFKVSPCVIVSVTAVKYIKQHRVIWESGAQIQLLYLQSSAVRSESELLQAAAGGRRLAVMGQACRSWHPVIILQLISLYYVDLVIYDMKVELVSY